jgi:hypothetical protein
LSATIQCLDNSELRLHQQQHISRTPAIIGSKQAQKLFCICCDPTIVSTCFSTHSGLTLTDRDTTVRRTSRERFCLHCVVQDTSKVPGCQSYVWLHVRNELRDGKGWICRTQLWETFDRPLTTITCNGRPSRSPQERKQMAI